MANNGYDQTYEDDRKQSEEDLDLPRRAGEAISNAASKAKDFVVDTVKDMPVAKTIRAMKDRYDATQLPMEKKAKGGKIKSPTMTYKTYTKTGKPDGMKTVKVSSASSRADGCCIRGKTRA